MAKKTTGTKALREHSLEDLQMRLDETKKQLFTLRLRATTKELTNPSEIRTRKREVARINTIMNEKRSKARSK